MYTSLRILCNKYTSLHAISCGSSSTISTLLTYNSIYRPGPSEIRLLAWPSDWGQQFGETNVIDACKPQTKRKLNCMFWRKPRYARYVLSQTTALPKQLRRTQLEVLKQCMAYYIILNYIVDISYYNIGCFSWKLRMLGVDLISSMVVWGQLYRHTKSVN